MPALNTSQPTLFKRTTDLNQQTDPTDAKLDSALAAVALAQQVCRDIVKSPTTGATLGAGLMARPNYIVTDVATYQTAVTDALTALTTAVTKLASIQSLT